MSTTNTSIQWTDKTWNPVRGCSRVSQGCVNCYAEQIAARFSGPSQPFQGFAGRVNGHAAWTGGVELIESALDAPLRWRKPARIFVNSMSDLFHEGLADSDIFKVFVVMAACERHTFQILTKRASRMASWVRAVNPDGFPSWPPSNVWLGVSVEDQKTADERIPHLLATPAAKRFVSYEPALDAVNFTPWLESLDWIIVGGESGLGARPFNIAWAEETLAQCKAAGVACFVKQLGANVILECRGVGWFFQSLKDRKGGNMEEWPPDLRVREFPE